LDFAGAKLAGVKRTSLDLSGERLFIVGALQRFGHDWAYTDQLKTTRSRRSLALAPFLVELLSEHLLDAPTRTSRRGRGSGSGTVPCPIGRRDCAPAGSPRRRWDLSQARQVHPAGGDLDEQEGIEATKERGVNRDEVAGDDAFGLGPQEPFPRHSRSPGRGVDARFLQDRPHGARRDCDPEMFELAVNASVAPGRVLLGETDDEPANLRPLRRRPVPRG